MSFIIHTHRRILVRELALRAVPSSPRGLGVITRPNGPAAMVLRSSTARDSWALLEGRRRERPEAAVSGPTEPRGQGCALFVSARGHSRQGAAASAERLAESEPPGLPRPAPATPPLAPPLAPPLRRPRAAAACRRRGGPGGAARGAGRGGTGRGERGWERSGPAAAGEPRVRRAERSRAGGLGSHRPSPGRGVSVCGCTGAAQASAVPLWYPQAAACLQPSIAGRASPAGPGGSSARLSPLRRPERRWRLQPVPVLSCRRFSVAGQGRELWLLAGQAGVARRGHLSGPLGSKTPPPRAGTRSLGRTGAM